MGVGGSENVGRVDVQGSKGYSFIALLVERPSRSLWSFSVVVVLFRLSFLLWNAYPSTFSLVSRPR